jgi:hypothetical protein
MLAGILAGHRAPRRLSALVVTTARLAPWDVDNRMTQSGDPSDHDAILRRLEQLERENARLREKVEPFLGPDNPNFKPQIFLKVLSRTILILLLPVWLGLGSMFFFNYVTPGLKMTRVAGVPVFSFAGQGGKVRGIGVGLISFGGLAVGAIAVGGMGFGLIAFGGCAVGVVAIGGGAVGVIAIGGGTFGIIAIGGGATGYFAMGQRAHGKYALGLNRQDAEAIDFFRRYVPGLRNAMTNPMPVILLRDGEKGWATTG